MVTHHNYEIYHVLNSIQGPGVLLDIVDFYLIFVRDKSMVRNGLYRMINIAQRPYKDPSDRQPPLLPSASVM